MLYLRVATADAKEQASAIIQQRQGCMRIANRHGLRVIHEYADIGRPAQLNQQIELLRLLGDLYDRRRHIRYVIIWDYSRLARSMWQLNMVAYHISSCGARILTLSGVEVIERFLRQQQADQISREED